MEANDLGFETVPFVNLKWAELNIQEAIDFFLDEAEKENLPQDGVVFKYEDVKYGKSLGSTSHHFNNGIAFKVFNESVESELINIEYTMGRTGILTPTAVFKPIEIEDTIVERASLHNISIMKEIMGKPWVGQHVGVIKSNLIIPQIRWAEQDDEYTKIYIDIPHMCPICGQPTKIVKDNNSEVLVCTNDNFTNCRYVHKKCKWRDKLVYDRLGINTASRICKNNSNNFIINLCSKNTGKKQRSNKQTH